MKNYFITILAITILAITLLTIFSLGKVFAESPPDRTMDGIKYSTELKNGFFVSGVDFPAGEYDITIISETGEVTFFDEKGNPLKPYSYDADKKFYEFINLPWGTYIKIINGTVFFNSFNISGVPLEPREQKKLKKYKFKSGSYISGSDFKPGVYDITVSGKKISGSFSNNNPKMEIVSAPMDSKINRIYKNIDIPKGMQLKLENLNVIMTPSE